MGTMGRAQEFMASIPRYDDPTFVSDGPYVWDHQMCAACQAAALAAGGMTALCAKDREAFKGCSRVDFLTRGPGTGFALSGHLSSADVDWSTIPVDDTFAFQCYCKSKHVGLGHVIGEFLVTQNPCPGCDRTSYPTNHYASIVRTSTAKDIRE